MNSETSPEKKVVPPFVVKSIPYVIILLSAIAVSLPWLIFPSFQQTHDGVYHFSHIASLNQAWQDGQFFSRIYSLIAMDYGYASGIFYSMLPAGMCVAIMNIFNTSLSVALFIQFFLLMATAGIVVYLFLKRVFKNAKTWVLVLATCCYIFFPYTLINMYDRGAYSEIFITLAMPLIAWAMYELFHKDNVKTFFPLFIAGSLLALFTHFTLFVYLWIFAAIFALLNYKKLFTRKSYFLLNWKYALPLILSVLSVVLIGALFWLPMLVNYGSTYASKMFFSGEHMMSDSYMYIFDHFWFFFCIAFILTTYITSLVIHIKKQDKSPIEKQFFIIVTVILMVASPVFPWIIIPNALRSLQFAFRLYSILAMLSVIMLVYSIKNIKTQTCRRLLICFTALVMISSTSKYLPADGIYPVNTTTSDTTYLKSSNGAGFGMGMDYYPLELKQEDYIVLRQRNNEPMVANSNIEVTEFANYQSITQISFITSNPDESKYVTLNLPFYLFDEDVTVKQLALDYMDITEWMAEPEPVDVGGTMLTKIHFAWTSHDSKTIINYEPDSAMDKYLKENPFEFRFWWGQDNGEHATNFVKTGVNYTVDFKNIPEGETKIELPTLYYKGYVLTYTTDSGDVIKLKPEVNYIGLMEIIVSESGTLSVKYSGQSYLLPAGLLTTFGILLCIGTFASFYLYPIIRKRRNKDTALLENTETSILIEAHSPAKDAPKS